MRCPIRNPKPDESQDGLVHISCIAAGRVKDVSEHLDVGEKVWVKAACRSNAIRCAESNFRCTVVLKLLCLHVSEVVNINQEEGKLGLDMSRLAMPQNAPAVFACDYGGIVVVRIIGLRKARIPCIKPEQTWKLRICEPGKWKRPRSRPMAS